MGINVYKMRYAGVMIGGIFGGIGGFCLHPGGGQHLCFQRGGLWLPGAGRDDLRQLEPLDHFGRLVLLCAVQGDRLVQLQHPVLPSFEGVKSASNIYQMLPYIVTMIVLIFTSKRAARPRPRAFPTTRVALTGRLKTIAGGPGRPGLPHLCQRRQALCACMTSLQKKRDGGTLDREELEFAVNGFVKGDVPDYQMSALLMAIYLKGMTDAETAQLTQIMAHSGDMVDLSAIEG